MIAYTAGVEKRLNHCLANDLIPDADLVDAIAVCKIRCIDVALQRCHALRLEVGSYALMHDTGFELMDMLLTCKFAEGDSRILQMKLCRDRLKRIKKDGIPGTVAQFFGPDGAEARAALALAQKLAPAGRNLKKMQIAMDSNWAEIYALSRLIEERHMRDQATSNFKEPIVQRLKAASTTYDNDWKKKI
eukprot:Awhi_evm1s13501